MPLVLAHADPWRWHPHFDVWLVMLAVAAGYFAAIRLLGPRWAPAGGELVSRKQVIWFGSGLALMWVFADYPIHDLSEDYLLWVHMVQHLVFTLVAPPMLLMGMPGWLVGGLLKRNRVIHAVANQLTRPIVAALVFNVAVVASHAPGVVNTSVRVEPVHFAVHTGLVFVSFMMWFPVVNRVPGLPQLGHAGRLVYLFLQSIVPTVPASFLTFAEKPIYDAYANAERLWGTTAVHDQQIAGAVMKLGGGTLLWGLIVVLFFRWYAADQRNAKSPEGTLTWDDVEREFARTAPPPGAPTPSGT